MSKTSRRMRKIYKEGRAAGYIEGYKDGLHDGNPFNVIIKAVKNIKSNIDCFPPYVREGLMIASEEYEQLEALTKNEEADE